MTCHSKLRRFSAADMGQTMVLPPLMAHQHSTVLEDIYASSKPGRMRIDSFATFSHLRFLLLNGPGIESIHDSLGSLIQLRHLDFSGTHISKLPNSIGCLTNLQILNLLQCQFLEILPEGITQLCSLRHLSLRFTPLRDLPKGIENLTNINNGIHSEKGKQGRWRTRLQLAQEHELMSKLAFAEKFIKLIAEVVENKVAEVLGVEDELQSLLEKLEDLIGHLGMLRGSAHDPDVGGRVKRLKDIMYNADDLVDLCKVNAERHTRSLENKASASHINWFIVLHHTQPWYV